MTDLRSQQRAETLRQVLGAFYKTVDVMKAARNGKMPMEIWADDMKAVEDVMFFLEQLRDAPEEITGAEMDAIEAAAIAGKPLTISASGDVRAAVIEALQALSECRDFVSDIAGGAAIMDIAHAAEIRAKSIMAVETIEAALSQAPVTDGAEVRP